MYAISFPIVRSVLLVFAALLPIVNPLGMAPIFAGMTFGYPLEVRRTVSLKVAINGVVLLLVSFIAGSWVLDFFGISLAAVQLGGGSVVMLAGWRLLNQEDPSEDKRVETHNPSGQAILSRAFYPLTMPLTVGPGSIAVAITLGSNARSESHMQLFVSGIASTIGILLIGVSIYLCYRYSDVLERVLGAKGTNIFIRLSAFLVVCIGIQIMFNGVNEFYSEMVRNAQLPAN